MLTLTRWPSNCGTLWMDTLSTCFSSKIWRPWWTSSRQSANTIERERDYRIIFRLRSSLKWRHLTIPQKVVNVSEMTLIYHFGVWWTNSHLARVTLRPFLDVAENCEVLGAGNKPRYNIHGRGSNVPESWCLEYHGIPKYSPKSVVHLVFCPNFKPWPCAVEEGFIYIMVGFRYIHSDSKWSSDSLSLQHSVYLYTQYGPNFVVLS